MQFIEKWSGMISNPRNTREHMFARSLKCFQAGNYTQALTSIDKVIAGTPNKAEPWLLRGYAIYYLGRFDEALQIFDHVLKLDPHCGYAFFLKGLTFIALYRYDEAARSCERGLSEDPGNPEGWYILGLALSRMEIFRMAISCYSRALHLSPGYREAAFGIQQADRNYHRQIETLDEIHGSLQEDPGNVMLINRMGKILAKTGRVHEAIATYGSALDINPENRDARQGIHKAEKLLTRWDGPIYQSLSINRDAREPDGDKQVAHPQNFIQDSFSSHTGPSEEPCNDGPAAPLNEGTCHLAGCSLEDATGTGSPQPPFEQTSLSIQEMVEYGQYDQAIEKLQSEIGRNPTDLEPVFSLIDLLMFLGRVADAASVCAMALEKDPGNASLWGRKGQLLMKTGKYEAADAAFSKSLGINSENPEILAERGDVCRKLGKYKEAALAYHLSLELKSDVATVWYRNAKALAMLKRYHEAIDACTKAISLDPHYIEALTYQGFLLSKVQRYHDALDVFEVVLRLDPQDRDALRIRQSLKGKV